MKTKTLKFVTTILMALFVLATISQAAFAVSIPQIEAQPVEIDGMAQIAGKILGLIQGATIILTIILVAVFGFKFVMGSANEKAEYQKSFIPLIVGVLVVFGATTIANFLLNTFTA